MIGTNSAARCSGKSSLAPSSSTTSVTPGMVSRSQYAHQVSKFNELNELSLVIARAEDPAEATQSAELAVEELISRLLPA